MRVSIRRREAVSIAPNRPICVAIYLGDAAGRSLSCRIARVRSAHGREAIPVYSIHSRAWFRPAPPAELAPRAGTLEVRTLSEPTDRLMSVPRKILVTGGSGPVQFVEHAADSEHELQTVLLNHPQLIPAEDLGLDGDLLVVGRETTLASGSIDLLCLSKVGEVVVVEFKTGPQNPDFRHALAQVIDYGSDLWKLGGWREFDEGVVHRYLSGNYVDPVSGSPRAFER